MAFNPANHFVVSGAGIDGTIDVSGISGEAIVSLTVDGRALRAPRLETTREGIVVRAIHKEVPDSHSLVVTVIIPQVNLGSEPQMGAGFAVLTTARTSIGGPGLVSGPVQLYELRPLALTASIAESLLASRDDQSVFFRVLPECRTAAVDGQDRAGDEAGLLGQREMRY